MRATPRRWSRSNRPWTGRFRRFGGPVALPRWLPRPRYFLRIVDSIAPSHRSPPLQHRLLAESVVRGPMQDRHSRAAVPLRAGKAPMRRPFAVGFGFAPGRRRIAAQANLRAMQRAVGRSPKPIPLVQAGRRSSSEAPPAARRLHCRIATTLRRSRLAPRSSLRSFRCVPAPAGIRQRRDGLIELRLELRGRSGIRGRGRWCRRRHGRRGRCRGPDLLGGGE